MKTFLVLTLCFAAVSAAPPKLYLGSSGSLWNLQADVLDDLEESFRKMRDEFDQLEKSMESRFTFPITEETGVGILVNGTNIFNLDPSKVKNESFSDTKVVDGKVVRTEEKVVANGNSVVHSRKVVITPEDVPTIPSDGQPKKPSKTPVSPISPVPAVTTSKNEIDSEYENTNQNSNPSRDVEEIESVSASAANIHSTSHPQKQIHVI